VERKDKKGNEKQKGILRLHWTPSGIAINNLIEELKKLRERKMAVHA